MEQKISWFKRPYHKDGTNSATRGIRNIGFAALVALFMVFLAPLPRAVCWEHCDVAITSLLVPIHLEAFIGGWENTRTGTWLFLQTFFYMALYFIAYFVPLMIANALLRIKTNGRRFLVLVGIGALLTIPLYAYSVGEYYRTEREQDIIPLIPHNAYNYIRLNMHNLDRDDIVEKYRYIEENPRSFDFPPIEGYEYDPFIFATNGGDDCLTILERTTVCFGDRDRPIVVFTKDTYHIKGDHGYYSLLETTDFTADGVCEPGWWHWNDHIGDFDPEKCMETRQKALDGTLIQRPNN